MSDFDQSANQIGEPVRQIFQVPLIDLNCIGKARDYAAQMPALQSLCARWSKDDTKRVIKWVNANRTNVKTLKYDFPSSNGNDAYRPIYDVDDHSSRSLEELAIVSQLTSSDLWESVKTGSFPEFLSEIGLLVGAVNGFRISSAGTALDGNGQAICYPKSQHITGQIERLSEWLAGNAEDSFGCAPIAMNAVFNLHPFIDRNGRCGRIIFNMLCGGDNQCMPFVPLYDLSVLSKGEFTLRLRLAQYRNNWGPLLSYLETSAEFLETSILATGGDDYNV